MIGERNNRKQMIDTREGIEVKNAEQFLCCWFHCENVTVASKSFCFRILLLLKFFYFWKGEILRLIQALKNKTK